MSGRLKDFLVQLVSSPELMARFAADPGGVLDGAGLAADEKDALLVRDSGRLRRALGASAADHLTQVGGAFRRPRTETPSGLKPGAKKRRPSKKRPTTKKRSGTKKR